MAHKEFSDRRRFIKWVVAAPLLGQVKARQLYAKAATAAGGASAANVYRRLGVKTVINCRGTWTYLSGSLEWPEVRAAQVEAAQPFRQYARAAARRRPAPGRTDGGGVRHDYIGSCGRNGFRDGGLHRGKRPPKHLAASRYHRSPARSDHGGRPQCFRQRAATAGGKLVLAFSPEEIEHAINNKTALIYTTHLGDVLQKELAIAKDASHPLAA